MAASPERVELRGSSDLNRDFLALKRILREEDRHDCDKVDALEEFRWKLWGLRKQGIDTIAITLIPSKIPEAEREKMRISYPDFQDSPDDLYTLNVPSPEVHVPNGVEKPEVYTCSSYAIDIEETQRRGAYVVTHIPPGNHPLIRIPLEAVKSMILALQH